MRHTQLVTTSCYPLNLFREIRMFTHAFSPLNTMLHKKTSKNDVTAYREKARISGKLYFTDM